jgi:hypothetical protein
MTEGEEYLDLPERVVNIDDVPKWAHEAFEYQESTGTWKLTAAAKDYIGAARAELRLLQTQVALDYATEVEAHKATRQQLGIRAIDHELREALRGKTKPKLLAGCIALLKEEWKFSVDGDAVNVVMGGQSVPLSRACEYWLAGDAGSSFALRAPPKADTPFSNRIRALL